MARLYRVRPSELLNGDLVDFNVDMVMGLYAVKDMADAVRGIETAPDDLGGGIAKAVGAGLIAGS